MDFHPLWWQNDLTEMHHWERDIHDAGYVWRITKEIQDWALISDAIVFQMLHGPGFKMDEHTKLDYVNHSMALFRAVKELVPNKPIFTEIDDHITSTPIYNAADPFYAPGAALRELAIAQFKESDGLIVSTPYLQEVYSEFNDNIFVVENSLDFKVWDAVKKKSKKGIRIGWAGGATHSQDLEILESVIPRITERHKDVSFVFVHGTPHSLRGLKNVEHIQKWTRIDKYPSFLGSLDFDIGIAPLVDNAFNRGKSNLRWLEYSGLGIPTVASKVGHFAQTINHGVDGFLAENHNEFEQYLEVLITDKKARTAMGAMAKDRARLDFNVDRTAQKYAEILQQAVDRKTPVEVLQ